MTRKRFITVFVIALSIMGLAGAWWIRMPVVETAKVTRGPAVDAVYATGVVEPVRWAKVTSLVRGRLAEICQCEGNRVKKGDLLARLDEREAAAVVAELEARELFLQQEAKRQQQLRDRGVASPQAYERAFSELTQIRAATRAAAQKLADLSLRAPIDGVVLRRDGEVGEVAEPGEVLFWVGEPVPLWVVAEVDEEDIPRVGVGQPVLIAADGFPGRTLTGAVDHITPKGDPVNKNYRVRVLLPDDTPLLIGMTVETNIVVRRIDDAVLAPVDTVVDGRVWVVEGGRVRAKTVETGIRGRDRFQILNGLQPDDIVVVAPPEGLREGARVRIMPASTGT